MADSFDMTSNVLDLIGKFESVRAGMGGVGQEMKKQVAARIIELIPTNTNWKNGTGTLDNSFFFDGKRVASSVAWAHRREFSFKGPDSLNRMFPNDPAGFFMKTTLKQVATDGTINSTFAELMGNLTRGGA
jgi:hypothetical protein